MSWSDPITMPQIRRLQTLLWNVERRHYDADIIRRKCQNRKTASEMMDRIYQIQQRWAEETRREMLKSVSPQESILRANRIVMRTVTPEERKEIWVE